MCYWRHIRNIYLRCGHALNLPDELPATVPGASLVPTIPTPAFLLHASKRVVNSACTRLN
ncbi:hypothetical protein K503DRAFT_806824 [Rhizopogon vinicolor AM-OR11-026]|uniref:Uncharacterized protein n=1 Tax=Rhizopogon vinicolor AM-OR11-026 TaxID=1314800 RepID=A0A1B7MDP0_9AGAM|nr:hypothetical protein K503DRAFT_806824 [Rhizopogon vinicolor AM-OR11-026]